MTIKYDFYTSSSRSVTTDGTGVTWGDPPRTSGIELWHGPMHWGDPYYPTIPAVIRRKPKKDPWEIYTEGMREIREIEDITEVTKAIEIRPVLICGWCFARIPRGMEDEPCEYCGS